MQQKKTSHLPMVECPKDCFGNFPFIYLALQMALHFLLEYLLTDFTISG